uniref:Uncharacterized protein LOC111137894 n=1 Tax=Crassostrea virginica TaxID=6565 RepID=A0A8B8EZ74_CRAVI|nr:uncharacterized protein LOC111137894 [Crassostrea virginica]
MKRKKAKECDLDRTIRYSVGSEQIYGVDGLYSRTKDPDSFLKHESKFGKKEFETGSADTRNIGHLVGDKNTNELKLENLKSEVVKNIDRINKLKVDILSKENGSYTSNDGKQRVKSLLIHVTILEDLESEIGFLQRNLGHVHDLVGQQGKRASWSLRLPFCVTPDTIYVRDLCDKSGNIDIRETCCSSTIHIEQCTDKDNHFAWLRKNNKISISGSFSSPKIYISGLFVNTIVSIKGMWSKPEIHLEGVCVAPKILVHGTKLKPKVYVDGIVSNPYLQVGGLGSRLKLTVRGICSGQEVVINGRRCHTKLIVFGMCNI